MRMGSSAGRTGVHDPDVDEFRAFPADIVP